NMPNASSAFATDASSLTKPIWSPCMRIFKSLRPLTLLLLLEAGAASAQPPPEPRRLSLGETLELAMRADPQVDSAKVGRERGELGVLRAQLDRFSLRIDATLTEQWRVNN